MFFWMLFGFVVLQRGIELMLAKRNERWMKKRGAIEVGKNHYPLIVGLHILFFVSLVVETGGNGKMGGAWPIWFVVFFLAQILRVWSLSSLGRYWNTKILVIPGHDRVEKGPYRWFSHPNYLVVCMELLSLPFLFGAWLTAMLFTLMNLFILIRIRIPAEEKALSVLHTSG